MKKIAVAAAIVLLVACGKKETTTPTGPSVPSDAPRYKTHRITVPPKLATSSDVHAQTVAYYMGLANALSASLPGYFLPPSLRKGGVYEGDGPWEYSWSEGEFSATVKIKASGDQYIWEVYYTGQKNDVSVSNWLGVRASQGKDERSGTFTSFVPPTSAVAASFTWSIDPSAALNFQVEAPSFMAGSRFVGRLHADGSGELQVFQQIDSGWSLVQKYQWTAEGAGEWWEFAGGVTTAQGSWN